MLTVVTIGAGACVGGAVLVLLAVQPAIRIMETNVTCPPFLVQS